MLRIMEVSVRGVPEGETHRVLTIYVVAWLERRRSEGPGDIKRVAYNSIEDLSGSRRVVCREEEDKRSTHSRYGDAWRASVCFDASFRHCQTRPIVVRV